MDLSEDDKALIHKCLGLGEPLPDRFRYMLFRDPREAELIWPGKTHEVTNVILPFQSIEQIDESRAERRPLIPARPMRWLPTAYRQNTCALPIEYN